MSDDLERQIEVLEAELAEVHAELNKLGVPASQKAHNRLREARWVALDEVTRRECQTKESVELVVADLGRTVDALRFTPYRRRLPDEREAVNHKFSVGGYEGYLTVGLFEDRQPGELFVRIAKEGSTVSGLLDSFAIALSLALQWGAPLRSLCDKFEHQTFLPSGHTANPDIPVASSIIDYVFKWLRRKFLPTVEAETPAKVPEVV